MKNTQKNIDTLDLTTYKKVPFTELEEKYHFSKKTGYTADGFGIKVENISVHTGDVSLAGDYNVGDENGGVYIIDGNLVVEGSFRHCIGDYYQIIYVTGDVRAKNLIIDVDAIFFVGGSVYVDKFLYTNLTDAGALFVGGETSAKIILNLDRTPPRFTKIPKAELVLVSEFVKDNTYNTLKDAKLASEHIDQETLDTNFTKFSELIRTGQLRVH